MADTAHPTESTDQKWPDLLGSGNWDGLLNPLDLGLRRLILHCGDLCQATYDAFNNDRSSRFCGSSRYGKSSFFQKVMFEPSLPGAGAGDLSVAAFLYATARVSVPQAFLLHPLSREAWDRESNWIGYVAVTSDAASRSSAGRRRDIFVAWRGTIRDYEWANIFDSDLESIKPLLKKSSHNNSNDKNGAKVMKGWLTIYNSDNPNSSFTKLSAKAQLRRVIQQLVGKYKDDKISIILTGHSLGASLSVLSAFDIAENVVPAEIPVTAILFGSPKVGNGAFARRLEELGNVRVLHVKNRIDLIPHYPTPLMGYRDVAGTELEIDTRKSPSLKDSRNPSDWHNLQAMLHAVAGWNGEEGEFEMRVRRSVALVNKSCGFLKEELLVPESWWVEKNKGMVRGGDGEWGLAPPAEEDVPEPEF